MSRDTHVAAAHVVSHSRVEADLAHFFSLAFDLLALAGFTFFCLGEEEVSLTGAPIIVSTFFILMLTVLFLVSRTRVACSPLELAAKKILSISNTLGGPSRELEYATVNSNNQ